MFANFFLELENLNNEWLTKLTKNGKLSNYLLKKKILNGVFASKKKFVEKTK